MSKIQPEKIGPYLIEKEILPAGIGRLFQATDPDQEGQFALRLLPEGFLDDSTFRAFFYEKMQALEECDHPGVVAAHLEEIDGQTLLVRPWLPGGTLAEWLARGPLPAELALSISSQVAAALDAAHDCGVIHQNLKPSNVLFNQNGAACLADFALVRHSEVSGQEALSWLDGAPGSLSPEAALGKAELNARSDVYALGALTFEMLCGQPPYPASRMLEAALQHLEAPLPDLKALRPDLPTGLVQTINRALAKGPELRFASAGEFASTMEWALKHPRKSPGWVKSMPESAPPATAVPRRGYGRAFALVFLILLASAAGLYLTGTLNRFVPELPAISLPVQVAQISPTTPPATHTPKPTDTLPPPSATHTQTAPPRLPTASRTPRPSATDVPTITSTPAPVVIGGANLLAFINENDIWTIHLDSSNLTRLIEDEQPKTDLQWTPDGKALTYSSKGCYYMLTYENLTTTMLGCFADLEISPDMSRFIIGGTVTLPDENKSWMNFLGQLNFNTLSTLTAIPQRSSRDGIAFIGGRLNQFSSENDLMAAVFKAPLDGRQMDMIQVFRLSSTGIIDVLDAFPSRRFTMSGYSGLSDEAVLDDFGWNGDELFTLHGDILHGYGDLMLYNMDFGRVEKINPINGKCCYQDIQFSPDGQYLLFAFQDNEIGEGAEIYLISLGMISSGATYTPITLPYYFFGDSRARVEPALRPEK